MKLSSYDIFDKTINDKDSQFYYFIYVSNHIRQFYHSKPNKNKKVKRDKEIKDILAFKQKYKLPKGDDKVIRWAKYYMQYLLFSKSNKYNKKMQNIINQIIDKKIKNFKHKHWVV